VCAVESDELRLGMLQQAPESDLLGWIANHLGESGDGNQKAATVLENGGNQDEDAPVVRSSAIKPPASSVIPLTRRSKGLDFRLRAPRSCEPRLFPSR
jgi:hypothetical protein